MKKGKGMSKMKQKIKKKHVLKTLNSQDVSTNLAVVPKDQFLANQSQNQIAEPKGQILANQSQNQIAEPKGQIPA